MLLKHVRHINDRACFGEQPYPLAVAAGEHRRAVYHVGNKLPQLKRVGGLHAVCIYAAVDNVIRYREARERIEFIKLEIADEHRGVQLIAFRVDEREPAALIEFENALLIAGPHPGGGIVGIVICAEELIAVLLAESFVLLLEELAQYLSFLGADAAAEFGDEPVFRGLARKGAFGRLGNERVIGLGRNEPAVLIPAEELCARLGLGGKMHLIEVLVRPAVYAGIAGAGCNDLDTERGAQIIGIRSEGIRHFNRGAERGAQQQIFKIAAAIDGYALRAIDVQRKEFIGRRLGDVFGVHLAVYTEVHREERIERFESIKIEVSRKHHGCVVGAAEICGGELSVGVELKRLMMLITLVDPSRGIRGIVIREELIAVLHAGGVLPLKELAEDVGVCSGAGNGFRRNGFSRDRGIGGIVYGLDGLLAAYMEHGDESECKQQRGGYRGDGDRYPFADGAGLYLRNRDGGFGRRLLPDPAVCVIFRKAAVDEVFINVRDRVEKISIVHFSIPPLQYFLRIPLRGIHLTFLPSWKGGSGLGWLPCRIVWRSRRACSAGSTCG